MSFNPDPSKQAQEIIFSRKKMKSSHPSVYFNNIPVSSTSVHKHLGMLLDDKLSYEHHLKSVLNKVKKTMATDYGDIIYGRAFNESFHKYL